jgi:hypothetical protein
LWQLSGTAAGVIIILGEYFLSFIFAGRDQAKTIKIMHDSNSGIFALGTLILHLSTFLL